MEKLNNPEAKEQLASLIESNMGLVVTIAKKFKPKDDDEMDEYIQLGRIGIMKAWKNYDPTRAKFCTAAWQYIRYEMLRHVSKKKHHHQLETEYVEAVEPSLDIKDYIPSSLNDTEQKLLDLKLKGYLFVEIDREMQKPKGWSNGAYKKLVRKLQNANRT